MGTKEPDFAALASALASADTAAKTTSADAGAARANRSAVAVNTITAAVNEKIAIDELRKALLDAGVLKGTVSKVATIVQGVIDGVLKLDDVKSLNGAYSTVTGARKAAAAARIAAASPLGGAGIAAKGAVVGSSTAPVNPDAAAKSITPEQALGIIVKFIKDKKDPDEIFRLAGEWMSRVTNELTQLAKDVEDDE